MTPGESRRPLESWKEIAVYLGKGVTTVQRWEKKEGLPVRRHAHDSLGTVYAYPEELDAWRAQRSAQPAAVPAQPPALVRRRKWLWAPVAAVLVALAAGGAVAVWKPFAQADPARSFQLTSGPESEQNVSLSPNGAMAVYAARRPESGCGTLRLYVQRVEGGDARLLDGPCANHRWPKWSPDGERIVYGVVTEEGVDIYIRPASGGPARRVARVGDADSRSMEVTWASWTNDGKSLILIDRVARSEPFAVSLLALDTSIRKPITRPPQRTLGDTIAAASPDGRSIAFARQAVDVEPDLYVTPIRGGDIRRLTFDHLPIHGIAWTPDSREIVFGSHRLSAFNTLWRVSASGGIPLRIGGLIDESVWPSTAKVPGRAGFRIAYQSYGMSTNLMRWDVSRGRTAKPVPVCPSTRFDWHAQLSPDGRRVAFSSNRSGSSNIWICEPDEYARQVTFFAGSHTDSPRWSPDGTRLLFTSRRNDTDSREVFLADLSTRKVRPLTNEPSDEGRASFSRDGKSIYFRSNRSGQNEIWKMEASGGPVRQITRTGAMEGFESPDGQLLYFAKDRPQLGVWSVPSEGGEEVPVIGGVRNTRWGVARDGIYFVTHTWPIEIMKYRFDTRKTERIYTTPEASSIWAGFSVASDGSSMTWPQTVHESSDLVVLDGVQ